MTRAGSNVPTNRPTTTVVETGPYRFTRNPIYVGMFLGQIGLAIAFDNVWLLVTLVPFALITRYGVVTREEAYLGRKFSDVYLGVLLARTALALAPITCGGCGTAGAAEGRTRISVVKLSTDAVMQVSGR